MTDKEQNELLEDNYDYEAEIKNSNSVKLNHNSNSENTSTIENRNERHYFQQLSLAERQNKLAKIGALKQAIPAETIFDSYKVLAVEPYQFGKFKTQAAIFLIPELDLKVVVPFNEYYLENPLDAGALDESSPDYAEQLMIRQGQFLSASVGSPEPFVITQLIPDSDGNIKIALGSVKKARQKIINRYWFNPRKPVKELDWVETDRADQLISCKVICLTTHAIIVEYHGVVVKVPQALFTMRWCRNLKDVPEFQVGKNVLFRIVKLSLDAEKHSVTLVLDHKFAERMMAMQRYHILKDGALVDGIITSIAQNKKDKQAANITIWLPNVELPAVVPNIRPADCFDRTITAGLVLGLRVRYHADNGMLVCYALKVRGMAK